jgi:hypothetical protein
VEQVTPEEFQKVITVRAVPEADSASQFWLYTHGLHELGLEEIELRQVPALFVREGFHYLNEWAYVSAVLNGGEHPDGPVNFELVGGLPLTMTVAPSNDEHWSGERKCVRFEFAGQVRCECCGGQEH